MSDTISSPELETLRARVEELERAETIQGALYRIAEAASSVRDMQEFYATIHSIVGELMYAANFHIALYDEERERINFPYYRDEIDRDVPDPNVWEPFGVGNARGTTAYTLRTGVPQRIDGPRFRELIDAGEIEEVGVTLQDSVWLGVPLQSQDRMLGVVVVQSYDEEHRLAASDLELLSFVGRHIAAALERTRLIDETRQRNAELSLVNDVQRGLAERLDMQAMYDLVGDRLQEIFDAQVVDIGIVDGGEGRIWFPYSLERGVRLIDHPIDIMGFRKIALETRAAGISEVRDDPRYESGAFVAILSKPIKLASLISALTMAAGGGPGERSRAAGPEGGLDPGLGERPPLRILLTEDNAVNQKLALRLLEKMGYRADVAGNGLEAIQAVERQPYDLILMDVQMPEMDGLEATRRIVDRWSESERPWIVAMTAEAMQGDPERCLAAGMDDYITKPIRPEVLAAAIARTPRLGPRPGVDAPASDEDPEMEGVVDRSVVARLSESMGGDPEFAADLIEQFVNDTPGLVETARGAWANENPDEVRRAAHTLKSNAATFGARELETRSRALEETARNGSLDGAAERIDGVAHELDRVRAALRKIATELTSGR
jgi:CheY-like chemotaxis protein